VMWPPLWSGDQSSWLQIRRPGFDSRHYQKKKCSGSGTGSTQPREYNWGATW
jgi:ribosomal protein L37E